MTDSNIEVYLPLNERVNNDIQVVQVSYDFINRNKNNPYKKPSPEEGYWRIEASGSGTSKDYTQLIITDYDGQVNSYHLDFIKKPQPIIVPDSYASGTIGGFELADYTTGLDCELHTITHDKIVLRAAAKAKNFIDDPQGFQLRMSEYKN
jgi:hypothetical protein